MNAPTEPAPREPAAAVDAPVHVALLGQASVRCGDRPPHVLERRDAALLTRLALHGPVGRADAAVWLWPDQDPAKAQAHLRQRLYRLRHALGVELVLSRPDLQLSPAVRHDLSDAAAPTPAADGRALLGTLAYGDCGGLAEWVDRARAEWRQRRRLALEAAAEADERAGRLDDALRHAEQLRQAEPASEHAHRRVMRLHYLRGDAAAGLAAFEVCRDDLRREVDAAPGAETQALAALLREAEVALEVAEPAPPRVHRVSLQRPPQRVGRAAEWQRMQAAWQPGAVLLLTGEGGVGKSRLAGDFLHARGGALSVKAHPGDAAVPYTLLAALLREAADRHGPARREVMADLQPWLPAPSAARSGATPEPLRLRQAFAQAIADWQGRGLAALWVDDLQFADPASLDLLLAWLAAAPGAEPAHPAVLLTLRPEGPAAALDRWQAEQPPGRVTALRLGGLDAAAVADMVRSTGHAAAQGGWGAAALAALHRRTGGNPLFVLEILRAGVDTAPGAALPDATPEPLRAMLLQRLARLPAAALRLARLAALAGADFSVELAAEVLQVHSLDLVDPWQQLADAEVLDRDGWTYDLMQEALRDAVPAPIARDLHGRIATALRRRGAAPGRVAEHAWHGEVWALAADQFERAAAAARAASRPQEELALLDRAVHSHLRCGRADAAFDAGVTAVQAAIVVEIGDVVAQRVAGLLAAAHSPSQRLDALLAQCRYALTLADWSLARVPAEQALGLARQLGDARREVAAVAWHGIVLALDGAGDASQALFEAALPAAQQLDDARVQLDFFANHGYALHSAARYAEALAPLRSAMALAERVGLLNEALVNATNISICLSALGDAAGAIAASEQGNDFWRRLGEPRGSDAAANHVQLGTYYLNAGRYAEAIELLGRALTQFRAGASPIWNAITEYRLALVYLRLGQPGRARQTLTPLHDSATPGNRAARLRIETQLDALAGRPVLAGLRDAVARLPAGLPARDRRSTQLLLGALLPADEAVPWCEALHREAARESDGPAALSATARLADALRRVGRADDAARMAVQGLKALATSEPLEMDLGEFYWLTIQALDAADDEAAVDQALRSALAWLERTKSHVPAEFVDSFCHRHPANRALLGFASRRLRVA